MMRFGFLHYLAVVVSGLGTMVGVRLYVGFAFRRGIVAHITARGLHNKPVPRGGGVILGGVFSLVVAATWLLGWLSGYEAAALAGGGAAATAVGFVDDVREIPPVPKLGVHVLLSVWLFACFYIPLLEPATRGLETSMRAVALAVVLFVPVWMINLHNFIDGVDGLASSATVFVSAGSMAVLVLTSGPTNIMVLFAIIGAAAFGFMLWNLPDAHVFMGDAGSIFLGYAVAALLLLTVLTGAMSVWTWAALLSYYIGDTTTTTVSRMFLVPHKWYGVHRSHAYQNIARMRKSHGLVTYGVAAYNVLWALPLALISALWPRYGPVAAAVALLPPVLWALRFGPRFSHE